MFAIIVRFCLGGALVAILPLIAHRFGPTASGVVLLFPAVSIAGLFFLGLSEGTSAAQNAALAAAISLPTVLAFLLTVVVALRTGLPLVPALAIGTGAWMVFAIPFVYTVQRRRP